MPEDKKKKPKWFKAVHYLAGKGMGLIPPRRGRRSMGQMGREARQGVEKWKRRLGPFK